jgi:ribokinase
LVQLEIPIEVVDAAIEIAYASSVAVVLDPAPVREVPAATLSRCAWITPNETEASALTGYRIESEAEGLRAAKQLHALGSEHAVVTLGASGLAYAGTDGEFLLTAPPADAIDTVAAGDAFTGALAVALVEKKPTRLALEFASAAAALATTGRGAQPSMPNREELDRFLSRSSKPA